MVTFVVPESIETTDYDEYTGRTQPSETVEVRSRVYGYLKSVEFQDGDAVQAGQLLYVIEPDQYDAIHQQSLAKIAVAESRLKTAQSKQQRMESLRAGNAVSKEEFEESLAAVDEAQANLISAKADAERTALDLKYTQVLAPIAGDIDRTLVTRGNLVTGGLGSGTLLTKIVNKKPLYVYFDVDEAALLRYRRQRAQDGESIPSGSIADLNIDCLVQLSDEQDFPHRGKLDFVETSLSQSTGTITLRATFANEQKQLPAGSFVRVRVPVGKPYTALMIPERSIGTDQSVRFVYVVDAQDTIRRKSVTLGRQLNDRRIITSGLEAGDRVVLDGLLRVRPDVKVTATAAQTPASGPTTPSAGGSSGTPQ
jgi:RND family efflux transporter MFP subunit